MIMIMIMMMIIKILLIIGRRRRRRRPRAVPLAMITMRKATRRFLPGLGSTTLISSQIFLLVNMHCAQICSDFLAQVAKISSNDVGRCLIFEWQSHSDEFALLDFTVHFFFLSCARTKLVMIEPKPPLINQHCVVYKFSCDLCDTDYVGYTSQHLFQRIAEHTLSDWKTLERRT